WILRTPGWTTWSSPCPAIPAPRWSSPRSASTRPWCPARWVGGTCWPARRQAARGEPGPPPPLASAVAPDPVDLGLTDPLLGDEHLQVGEGLGCGEHLVHRVQLGQVPLVPGPAQGLGHREARRGAGPHSRLGLGQALLVVCQQL